MRPIDADALVEAIKDYPYGFRGMIICDIAKQPNIDAVPVTRCRDCKHRQAKMGDCYGNAIVLCKDGLWRDMEFFCADGERNEDD